MRHPSHALLFLIASGVVVSGSCIWAWTTHDFWQNVPLYPCAAAAGVLAAIAAYLGTRRFFRATLFGGVVLAVTLVGTAIITIYRWEI